MDKHFDSNDRNLRWARAAAWARGQSFGPWAQGLHHVDKPECRRIHALCARIEQVGEDQAAAEYFRGTTAAPPDLTAGDRTERMWRGRMHHLVQTIADCAHDSPEIALDAVKEVARNMVQIRDEIEQVLIAEAEAKREWTRAEEDER
jgi:hypothetical protein